MRSLFVSLTLAILATGCGNPDNVHPVNGRVALEPAVLDYGRVALGSTVERVVTVRNHGLGALALKDVRIDGLGQDFTVSPGQGVIAGGDRARVRVRYTPRAEEVLERRLELDVDDPLDPTVGVDVKGVAMRPFVDASPLAMDFGRIEVGAHRELSLALKNDFPLPVDVELRQTGDAQFHVKSGVVAVAAHATVHLPVNFAPTRAGAVTGALTLKPCPLCTEVGVSLSGEGIERALVVEPDPVDFRAVPIDGHGLRTVSLRNAGTLPLTIQAVEDVPGGADESGFTIDPPKVPVTLAEGDRITFDAHFAATRLGPAKDTFQVRSSSHVEPVRTVVMQGVGGGPEIRVDSVLAFGRVPVGARAYAVLRISNVGAIKPDLEIPDSFTGGPGFEIAAGAPLFGVDNAPPAGTVVDVAAGDAFELRVWYEPTAEAQDQGTLRIYSNDGSAQPFVEVRLVGRSYVPGECLAEVKPERIDFGTIDAGKGAVLGYRIYNIGAEPCILRDIDIVPGSDPAFELPGGRIESYVVPPFTSGSQMVGFNPANEGGRTGDFQGELMIHVVNAADPQVRIPLVARSGGGCLFADPSSVDFGIERLDCAYGHQVIHYFNTCTGPVDVAAVRLDDLSRDNAFFIAGAPGAPFQVPAGGTFDVSVEWIPPDLGLDFAALMVDESGRAGPYMVPMYAEATRSGATTDTFVQHAQDAVDVLLVIDNSGSMLEEQQRVADSVGALLDEAQARGVNLNVAVTTTGLQPAFQAPGCPGGADGGEAGRFFPVDNSRPRIITLATPDAATVLQENVQVGLCHHLEQGMEAMRLALSRPLVDSADDPRTPQAQDGNAGFLRREASLAVVFVSEEDDRSGARVSEYESFLAGLKGLGGTKVYAVVDVDSTCADASGVATRYRELVQATGGVARSICQNDFGGIFGEIADDAFRPRAVFHLSKQADGSAITVRVDGHDVPAGDYWFDASTGELGFEAGHEPPVGSEIEVSYRATCS